MKYVEVECKFRLEDCRILKTHLYKLGAKKSGTVRQVDTYYNAPHRDFLAPDIVSEWFRIRDENGKISINYKRWLPLGVKEKTHCDEFETVLEDGEAAQRLLEALDFSELVKVDKVREKWVLGDSFVVALDSVAGLGSFVEFEYKGNTESVEDASEQLTHLIEEIGIKLGERDRRGYPYQLLERQGHEPHGSARGVDPG
ncbi:MAG: class IV adenylate cyclase [Actinomycetota bacterium]